MTDYNSSKTISRRTVLKSAAALTALPILNMTAARAAGKVVALVHTQAAGDAGPVDSMIGKLKKLASEKGFEARAIYAKDPATYETTFRTLGDTGASIVVTTFDEVAEPLKAVAPAYPKTKFIQLFADPFDPAISNVVTVSYDYYLGCYLSGIFAAQMSKSGKIGYIGGISIPPLNADFNAFKAGAFSIKKDATVTSAFAGSFQDPAKGQEIATQMYASGIDYIQTDSAATDAGIIAAANEKEGRLVSVLDPAQFTKGPKSIVSIVGLDFGQSLYNEVTKALGTDWKGGHVHTGLGTGVIDFILSPVFQKEGQQDVAAAAKKAEVSVATARAKILDGSLKVDFNTTL